MTIHQGMMALVRRRFRINVWFKFIITVIIEVIIIVIIIVVINVFIYILVRKYIIITYLEMTVKVTTGCFIDFTVTVVKWVCSCGGKVAWSVLELWSIYWVLVVMFIVFMWCIRSILNHIDGRMVKCIGDGRTNIWSFIMGTDVELVISWWCAMW